MTESDVTLITGFPSRFLAVRIVEKLVERDHGGRDEAADHGAEGQIRLVVPEDEISHATAVLDALPSAARERIRIYEGRTSSMDLGLSGAEFRELAAEVTVIHHAGGMAHVSTTKTLAEQENVAGMREVLELATEAPRLERLVHWSSASVSGARRGYVLEDELQSKSGFHNPVERSLYKAESMLRRAGTRVPFVVLRPTTIVGDSVTGEIDRFEGPYLLVLLLLGAPGELRLPMPGHGDTPMNLVPIDYVVDAGVRIASQPKAIGRTFHIVDPDPMTARRVVELIADAAGRPVPRPFVPGQIATTLLRTPGLGQFSHVPRAFLDQLRTEVVYDDRNTKSLLAGSGLSCPSFEEYADAMVRYVRSQQADLRAREIDEILPDHEPL